MSFLARILAAISHAMRGVWTFIGDTFDEVFEPITKRVPWMRSRARAAGRAIDRGVSVAADAALDVAAVTADVALRAPGVIGRELGSIVASAFPAPAVTGRALAEAGVVGDEEIQRMVEAAGPGAEFERQRPWVGHGHFLQHAVEAYRDGGEKALAPHVRWISEPAAEWIRTLSHTQMETALAMAPEALKRHTTPERASDVSPLLPVGPAPKVDPLFVTEEMKADILARAKRSMAGERAGVAEMMQRGTATPARPEPRFDATADEMLRYGRGYRPRGAY
ncbi:protein of unknown function [Methylorubrum extorquens DM4]|uniref:Uncharacterized protein n=1 Tax=Methylorubrum extorquens (strain DSM 6343 / CIP 106787 / DM4) TaxID=661410 RepID=C7C9A7_METED|nr:hypothetical protein [Methylorubrum extorquens]CAX22073.1 protein of unknown function [Methylorubrum extorquens DM4]